jgi:site-specific DNA recombinase
MVDVAFQPNNVVPAPALSNHFYIGEVKYKNEILPGEQPPIMDRTLFEAVRQKSLAQWSHRTVVRNKSDHLLTGLLFDDAGHRMIPTHATKAGIRYRYYASTPVLHGEAKTASAGSISRVPAADIEDAVVKSLEAYLAAKQNGSTSDAVRLGDREASIPTRQKPPLKCANAHGDQNPGIEWPEIPAETASR